MTSMTPAHPGWCDPRLCRTDGHVTRHVSTPTSMRSSVDDVEVDICLIREDGGGAHAHVGEPAVRTVIREDRGEVERVVDVALSGHDARMVAAALVTAADQLAAMMAAAR